MPICPRRDIVADNAGFKRMFTGRVIGMSDKMGATNAYRMMQTLTKSLVLADVPAPIGKSASHNGRPQYRRVVIGS